MVLQRFSEHTPMPWANGGGTSYEIASDRDAQGEWTWRIALAPVLEDGDFSRMPCVDRKLLLVEGEGLQLTIDGKVSPCRPGVVVAFRGEAHTSATLARGPVVDLGLMFHRKKAKGNLWFEAQPGAVLDADVVVGIGGDAQIEVDGETCRDRAQGCRCAIGRESCCVAAGRCCCDCSGRFAYFTDCSTLTIALTVS
jgi:environmental stress-induced protein Ves